MPVGEVATGVAEDFDYWGKDAEILTGADNNPFYETDEEHCLIALKTMGSNYGQGTGAVEVDSYHFMVIIRLFMLQLLHLSFMLRLYSILLYQKRV